MSYDVGDPVRYAGVTGYVGVYPPTRSVAGWEKPSDTALWFIPLGWPDFMGTWVEPHELQKIGQEEKHDD
jgi:hypothetical protein